MGIPDITKFVCRSAPSALCRVAGDANHTAQKVEFDFVLVDATNADQALGIAKVKAFLQQKHLVVKRAIIFALDSERDRAGTSRHHKQTHLYVGNLDVKVQSLCTELDHFYREEQKKNGTPQQIPQILMSGRGVAGEADYKILDMQRFLLTAALANKDTALPTFLFISEDSDVLCGTLCGPAPHLCSIATTLNDTLSQFCILSITQVLAYIGVCIDVFQNQKEEEEEEEGEVKEEQKPEDPPKKEETSRPKVATKAEEAPATTTTATEEQADVTAAVPTATTEDVVRRKKVEGPVAFGNACVALSDSSDDDDDDKGEVHPVKASIMAASLSSAGKAPTATTGTTAPTQRVGGAGAHTAPTPESLASAHMIHSSAVDLVFLFLVVMGNDLNVPSLLHGATKVDSSSCWHTYCNKKYVSTFGEEVDLGHNLLHVDFGDDAKEAALRLDGKFLCSILETMHYADSLSRQPGWEEIQRAKAYLAEAVYATMRYIVACNVESGAALKETFLDARQLHEVEGGVPTLASVLWLLHNEPNQRYRFSVEGLKKDAARGTTANLVGSSARPNAPRMQLDVGNSLVSPVAVTTSWAVRRGGAGSNCTLASLVDTSASHTARARHNGSSVAQLIKTYLGAEAPFSVPQTPGTSLFSQMERVWQRTLSGELPRLRKVALNGVFVSHVTGKNLAVAGASTSGGSAEAHAAVSKPPSVYSFELRRMTPVMANVPTTATTTITTTSEATTADKGTTSANTITAAPLTTQQRMMAALGMSLDYDKEKVKAPMEPRPSKRARTLMDEEEKKEFHRLEKISKKEGEQLGKRVPNKDKPKSDAPKKNNELTPGAPTEPKIKKKRLGKKERLLMQKMRANKEAPKSEEPKAE